MMNRSSYDRNTNLASVQPGARWKNVYYDLLHQGNVTVTGGRDGDVGVGGFLLGLLCTFLPSWQDFADEYLPPGGGNSFFTGRTGFGCDAVVNYEVVLANGSVIRANATQNADLYKSLKGGALNFGIVTGFDLRTLPAKDIAYGLSILPANYTDQALDLVNQFTDLPEDVAANDALVTALSHIPDVGETILLIRANTDGNLNSANLARVGDFPALESSWGLKSMADAANGSQVDAGTL
jgi:FAD/FMN-containing dehydrogenase